MQKLQDATVTLDNKCRQ